MKKRLWHMTPYDDAPLFRVMHIAVAVLILFQIINSNFTERESLGQHTLDAFITWVHISSGILLIVLGVFLFSWMLVKRGFFYYFSWVKFDFKDILQDVFLLKHGKLPEAHHGGLAATVQGAGVLALLIVAMSGGLWFLLESINAPLSLTKMIIHWHKFMTAFVEIYFFSHGAMGVLHLFLRYRQTTV